MKPDDDGITESDNKFPVHHTRHYDNALTRVILSSSRPRVKRRIIIAIRCAFRGRVRGARVRDDEKIVTSAFQVCNISTLVHGAGVVFRMPTTTARLRDVQGNNYNIRVKNKFLHRNDVVSETSGLVHGL